MSDFSITLEERTAIAKSINIFFQGTIEATPDQITEEVVSMFGTVLQETANGTKAVLTLFSRLIQGFFSELLTVPVITESFFLTVIHFYYNKKAEDTLDKIADMIVDEIVKYRMSNICYQTVKLKWRSPMQLVLLGL